MTVTTQSALDEVQLSARRLVEAARELVLIAVEDRPRFSEVHLVTLVHDAALDLGGEAEQADSALQPGGPSESILMTEPSQAVALCQAHVNLTGAVLVRELATPERLNDLTVFGRNRGREASAWAKEILRCIESCQHLLWTDTQPALLSYWRELASITDRTCPPAPDAKREREGNRHDA
jgi:hypothetical protein